jgi:Mg-chelatase subunit ChlD
MSGIAKSLLILLAVPLAFTLTTGTALAQGTALGEIEGRAAPVARRMCISGANAGDLCNEDSDCPGSTCFDRNVFNISVAVHYDASNADLTAIENLISAGSAVLFDVTDGQAEIGQATIHNNAFGTSEADLRVYPRTCVSGPSTGNICTSDNDCPPNPPNPAPGTCGNGVWWWANTGNWKNSGSMHVSIDNILAETAPGESFAHEFTHLVFDARDEYEARPGCGWNTTADSCPSSTCASGTSIGNVCTSDNDCPPNPPNPAPGICAPAIPGEAYSLMDAGGTGPTDGPFSEYCWGQGNSANLTDISGGNHDADNTTEQSQCRSNRSNWDQVVWSWPNVFQMPAAAPDPAAGGAVVNATQFIRTSETRRIVLILDESGSMSKESPSRMERLKVAAKDFVALAETGTELGIVSYSDDAESTNGRANVPISALGANRSSWNNAIDGLSPDNWTNIGAGLQKAQDMITTAGGVTANTYIVLMTDGLNNRPSPQATADADLQAKIADLLADGIPVYVTCTGSDRGLQSQCSEIAAGTGGHYVDSADAAALPEAFVSLHERSAGYQQIVSVSGFLSKTETASVFVEPGSEFVSFTLNWDKSKASAGMTVIDPDGKSYDSLPMPQGRYVRVSKPLSGEWFVRISVGGDVFIDSAYVLKAFSFNRVIRFTAGVSHPTVKPGEAIRISAFPHSLEGAVSHPKEVIRAGVIRPDGSVDSLELHDQGRDNTGMGDDVPQDGIFTGIYRKTQLKGAYTFDIRADIEGWRPPLDSLIDFRPIDDVPEPTPSPRFVRQFIVSATVAAPGDFEPNPEDGPDRPDESVATAVASYLIGSYDLREGQTRIHVMNPTAEDLTILVALFTVDGKPQRCVDRELPPNGLFELQVKELDPQVLLGVVKVVSLDPRGRTPKLGIVGNQRIRYEGGAVSETGLHPVSETILEDDLKRILSACGVTARGL